MKKGFTLIELLIVIAVLGILAAGVLATIDPFEQFKKARDTNARNSTVELYNAFIRFNANHGAFPWNYEKTSAGTSANCSETTSAVTAAMGTCVSALISDGELKTGFTSSLQGGVGTTMTYAGTSDNIAVCFRPDSKTIRTDLNTKYDANGVTTLVANCTAIDPNVCYWCAK